MRIYLISDCIFLCHLQADDSSFQQLDEEYQSVISALRSQLDSRAAPPVLHLDMESLTTPPSPTPFAATQVHNSPSSFPLSSSLLPALMNDIQKFRAQDGSLTGDMKQISETSDRDVSPNRTKRATSEDLALVDSGEVTAFRLPVKPTTFDQPVVAGDHTATTADPRRTIKRSSLRRKHRSLLRKRQIPGASGKGTCRAQFCHFMHAVLSRW